MMRFVLLLSVPTLCAAACPPVETGSWPSLAIRPGEVAPLVPRPTAVGAAGAVPRPAPATADAASRLASVERDLEALTKRLRAQGAASDKVASGAAGTEADAARQLERTRADRLGGQATDLRGRLDELAGDLARRAAAGDDVIADLKRTGNAIERVEALRIEAAAARR